MMRRGRPGGALAPTVSQPGRAKHRTQNAQTSVRAVRCESKTAHSKLRADGQAAALAAGDARDHVPAAVAALRASARLQTRAHSALSLAASRVRAGQTQRMRMRAPRACRRTPTGRGGAWPPPPPALLSHRMHRLRRRCRYRCRRRRRVAARAAALPPAPASRAPARAARALSALRVPRWRRHYPQTGDVTHAPLSLERTRALDRRRRRALAAQIASARRAARAGARRGGPAARERSVSAERERPRTTRRHSVQQLRRCAAAPRRAESAFSSVLLPQPLGPMMASRRPGVAYPCFAVERMRECACVSAGCSAPHAQCACAPTRRRGATCGRGRGRRGSKRRPRAALACRTRRRCCWLRLRRSARRRRARRRAALRRGATRTGAARGKELAGAGKWWLSRARGARRALSDDSLRTPRKHSS
jgi:hypothetical protein